ncbi:SMI1/KNR4 family protein [Rubellicoccus peritrichatus]|uniref:SMI1/KNR4 family protein n=1 Tax=Rubellicoccus peritrichatus TaxID=3080537 RepID=A0AAQ3QW93_9BACT|nr:SMI1/KNR4 family protein [Puniceicoccus sp. CR14]WOO41670.1 SMI1/KNR4 family protein [Puniceicoccus sp. CR14]
MMEYENHAGGMKMNFDERLKIIWKEPQKPGTEAPADAVTISEVEAKLGVKIPAEYLSLIKIKNGGHFNWFNHCEGCSYITSELWGIREVGKQDWQEVKQYMEEEQIDTPRDIDNLYPFAGDGHEYICFDYRDIANDAEPSIACIDVECFDEDTTIAPTFREYIDKLEHRSIYMEYAIEISDDSAEFIIHLLEGLFPVTFVDKCEEYNSDTYNACYPSLSNWKQGLPFDWIWLKRCKSNSGYHSCFQVPNATWFLSIGNREVPTELIEHFEAVSAFKVTPLYKP